MSTIRVISGRYKGRSVPFPTRNFSEAEITPQRVKGAVFSMLGEDLSGLCFLDLFSGSGQMAVEALSRGAAPVLVNELDKSRFQSIRSFVFEIGAGEQSLCLNMTATRALGYFSAKGFKVDVLFLDPPYDKTRGPASSYGLLLEAINEKNILSDGACVIIQHYSRNRLTERVGSLQLEQTKKYGNTSLAVYRRQ